MSLVNRNKDMTPFDMGKKPCRQSIALLPFIWIASFAATRKNHLKIKKIKMKGIKPPFIVLSTHQGFSDYYIAPLALFPYRANYVSDMEGFAAFGKGLYRRAGCLGKRRYVPEISLVNNIFHVLRKNRDIIVVFPESRHSNIGTTSLMPKNMGRLCKLMKVPVVCLTVHGSYLANPFWDEEHSRKAPIEATLECICTAEELQGILPAELQSRIEKKLSYDEYFWQYDNRIAIKGANLAAGLHKPLYQCKNCGREFSMESSGNTLSCKNCGAAWSYTEYGELVRGGEHLHIPDWYEWERGNVTKSIDAGRYKEKFNVKIEALPNEKGFVSLGEGYLTHDEKGFVLQLHDEKIIFLAKNMESLQTEYNYRGKGACIVLSTRDCCYYIYSKDKTFNSTKLQFAAEYIYGKSGNQRREN